MEGRAYRRLAAAVAAVLALTFASCRAADETGAASPPASTPSPDAATASPAPGTPRQGIAVLRVERTALGEILVDEQRRTLYVFMNDTANTSNCSGQCAEIWPPLYAEEVEAGEGVDRAKIGTTTSRQDNRSQATYAERPLYRYAQDTAPGETKGQGRGGVWFVISPGGEPIR